MSPPWQPDSDHLEVIAYAGYRGEQEPRALVIAGERREVLGIDDRWHDPEARYFKVAANDGRKYLLRFDTQTLTWSVGQRWTLDA